MRETAKQWIDAVEKAWERVQEERPLIHIIPNMVSAAFMADAVSALGGRPLMAMAEEEAEEITAYADALVVNLGQPSPSKLETARRSLCSAKENQVPVLLDPVGAGASKFRRESIRQLLELEWNGIVKANQAELDTLLNGTLQHQGVDGELNKTLCPAPNGRFVYAVTGAVDRILSLNCDICLPHQTEALPYRVVGTGCVAGSLCGTFAAVAKPEVAATAGLAAIGYAIERAEKGHGYGTYKVRILDEISGLNPEKLKEYLERSWCGRAMGDQ